MKLRPYQAPRRQPKINDMIYPPGSRQGGNVWIGGILMNVQKDATPPTPTPTPSITPTSTVTPTPSITPTQTVTPTNTVTPTQTVTPTSTVTPTPSVTPSITPTSTLTPTTTPTQTTTPTPSTSPPPPASISFITQVGSNTDANSYSFTSTNIGGSGLIVLSVGVYVDGAVPTKTITGITINGLSTTFQTLTHNGNLYFATQTLAYVRITSGTTADIVISFGGGNGTPANCNVGVFRIQNNISDTPNQTAQGESGSNTQSFTLTSLPPNSVGVMGISQWYERNGPSVTNATNQYTTVRESGKYSAANFTSVGGGNLTITNTYSNAPGGNDVRTLIYAWA